MDVSKILYDSFNDIISNPKILLPYLISSILISLIVFSFFYISIIYTNNPLNSYIKYSNNLSKYNTSQYNYSENFSNIPALSALSYINSGSNIYNLFLYLIIILIIISVFSFIISTFIAGTITALVEQIKKNKKLKILEAFRKSSSKFLSLICAGIIIGIIGIICIGIPLILGIFSILGIISFGILLGIFFIIFAIIIAIFFTISFFLVNTLIIIEGLGPIEAIKKSFKIGLYKKLEIFILLLLIFVILFIFDIIISIFSYIPILNILIIFILEIFISTWFLMVPVYFYYQLIKEIPKNKKIQNKKSK
ncbi:MAG: hypothetical protein QXD23_01610 [Candidatus Micrarchaeaceae archaeon]